MRSAVLTRPIDETAQAAALDHGVFSTTELARSEQFEHWRQFISPLAEARSLRPPGAGFPTRSMFWDLASIALVRSQTPSCFHIERSSRHIRGDSIDHWFIAYSHLARGEQPALRVGSLRDPFEADVPQMDASFLFVPRDFCQGATGIVDAAEGRKLEGGLVLLLSDFLLDLERRLPLLTPVELPGMLATTQTMILACLAPTSSRIAEAQRPIDMTLLERARRVVQDELLSPGLNVEMLCKRLGVSRSRLYRLFEPSGGIAHYIRTRRLLDAHVSLADTHNQRRIADIAADRGFLDAAEFSRAFKREFGYTPSDVRRDAVREPQPVKRELHAGEGHGLSALLKGLRSMPMW